LETLPRATNDAFLADFGLIQQTIRSGIVSSRATAADNHWTRWTTFCLDNRLDPLLRNVPDPVPFLQIWGARYRDGRAAPSGQPVRSGTVEDAMRAVGQTFASMGSKDIRKDNVGNIDFRIQRQLRSYRRTDPPPSRVKPVPIQVLHSVLNRAFGTHGTAASQAVADMIVIAFYYLLRPGEYTGTTTDNAPFRLQDVQLFIGRRRLTLLQASPADLQASTSASLTFTTQKNGVRGEVVLHGRSGCVLCCPVAAIVRRVLCLRQHEATPSTPLATSWTQSQQCSVSAGDITTALRLAVTLIGPDIGLVPNDISARSLRAGGAMALLCAQVDTDIIRLLGRWQSDAMMRYLHLQALPAMNRFATLMTSGGNYNVTPGHHVPVHE
jgi:hypothetical protein